MLKMERFYYQLKLERGNKEKNEQTKNLSGWRYYDERF